MQYQQRYFLFTAEKLYRNQHQRKMELLYVVFESLVFLLYSSKVPEINFSL